MTSTNALVYGEQEVKPPSERKIIRAAKVSLYTKIDYTRVVIPTFVLSTSGLTYHTDLQWKLHGHCLPLSAVLEMFVIMVTDLTPEFQTMQHSFTFITNHDVPQKLSEVFDADICSLASNSMKLVAEDDP